jgi:hypothetical protein
MKDAILSKAAWYKSTGKPVGAYVCGIPIDYWDEYLEGLEVADSEFGIPAKLNPKRYLIAKECYETNWKRKLDLI